MNNLELIKFLEINIIKNNLNPLQFQFLYVFEMKLQLI
jgi:hypothetical protein